MQNRLILPWTSVFGARSHQTSWPEWNHALLGCLLGSWDIHTSLKADNFEDMPCEISSLKLISIGYKHICYFFSIQTKWFGNAKCCIGFTCEPRVCFGPPCFALEFLQPRKTPKIYNLFWTEDGMSQPVSSGYFQVSEQWSPQCIALVLPCKPESISEIKAKLANISELKEWFKLGNRS